MSKLHPVDHAVCGVAVFKAGEALDKRRRLAWMVVAAATFYRCHVHHHGK